MKKIKIEYTLEKMTDQDYKDMYQANKDYVIPEELKEIIKALADK